MSISINQNEVEFSIIDSDNNIDVSEEQNISSIIEYLYHERQCSIDSNENYTEEDIENIMKEINCLNGTEIYTEYCDVDVILKKAEQLIKQPVMPPMPSLKRTTLLLPPLATSVTTTQQSISSIVKYQQTLNCKKSLNKKDLLNKPNNGCEIIVIGNKINEKSNIDENHRNDNQTFIPSNDDDNQTNIAAEISDYKHSITKSALAINNILDESIKIDNFENNIVNPSICAIDLHQSEYDIPSYNSPKTPQQIINSPIAVVNDQQNNSHQYNNYRNCDVLQKEIDNLQDLLKNTQERLHSLKLQYDSLTDAHREIKENNTQLQSESNRLKIEIQHLNNCANVLRGETENLRKDRDEAVKIQKLLQQQIDDVRDERKRNQEQNSKDAKTIQDLDRQCKEMQRILMRKHPDSVSALIVASNKSNYDTDCNSSARRLLEKRIAQLEADAKEQDQNAQAILTNVQSHFQSVQLKYETHITDLETQVLNLQQINAQLNEEMHALTEIMEANNNSKLDRMENFTQTVTSFDMNAVKNVSTQTDLRTTTSAALISNNNNNININSKQMNRKTKSGTQDDTHLLLTIRGLRQDLTVKDKIIQRLNKELDECKKTVRKLQKERDLLKSSSSLPTSRKQYDSNLYSDTIGIKEAINKIKLLEFDYKILHDKRIEDLKTLHAAHEREMSACNDTIRILQERLNCNTITNNNSNGTDHNMEKHKIPIDYFELKAKVSSLEQRHTEREQRLHLLVEALGRERVNNNNGIADVVIGGRGNGGSGGGGSTTTALGDILSKIENDYYCQ